MTLSLTYPHRPQSELAETNPQSPKKPHCYIIIRQNINTLYTLNYIHYDACVYVLFPSLYGHS